MAIRVLYTADCETQVITVHKGMDNYTFSTWIDDSTWLRAALDAADDIEYRHLKIQEVLSDFPATLEDMRRYDVIVLSDVGINSLSLLPSFRPPHAVPMGPNRVDNLRRYVEGGGGLLMCGGYFSFSGYSGRAGYGGSPIEAVLPVTCERGCDDRVEVVEGYRPRLTTAGRKHPITRDLAWDDDYLLLGYNRVTAKPTATVLADFDGNPQIAVAQIGHGRSMAFASDVAPHWAGTFVHWSGYAEFWARALRWLAGGA